METKRNDSLVEFELQSSEMDNVTGGINWGRSGGIINGDQWCAGDWGDIDTQKAILFLQCEPM
ncbi:MAG: hypothetical protein HOO91_19350 [Bacteroidales bacterium]|nr:hypothetical protein [Bacteroidales bacterium]